MAVHLTGAAAGRNGRVVGCRTRRQRRRRFESVSDTRS